MTSFHEITEETWLTQVAEAKGPILVDFQAPNQGTFIPNDMSARINGIWGHPIRLVYADVSKLLDVVLFYRIHDLPTLCLFYKGHIHKVWTGPDRIEKMLSVASELASLT